jgi:hypothetical protein
LKQLIKGLPDIPEPIEKELRKLHRNGKPLGLDEAMKMFHEVCKLFDRTYVCLDATDECQHLDRLLDSLQKAPPSAYLFCTGRSHVQHIIQKHFPRSYEIVVKAQESDIKLLIEERINNDCKINPEIIDEELKQCITEKISDLSQGMFVIIRYINIHTFSDGITDFSYPRFILTLFLNNEANVTVEMP